MPVRFTPSGEHHDRGDYSFYTRETGSRDFAKSRRFGDDDGDESRTMSLVSTPLEVPLIGKRRSMSPSQRYIQRSPAPPQQRRYDDNFDNEEFQEEVRTVQQSRRAPVESRRRYEYRNYDYDDTPLEPLVPTYQPRIGRTGYRTREVRFESSPPRRQRYQQPKYDDEYDDVEVTRYHKQQRREEDEKQQQHEDPRPEPQLPSRQQRQDEELEAILNWRKRAPKEPLVHTDFGYVMPPMRKRGDAALQQDDEKLRSSLGYIARRRQFAVEDDDDMQYYRNPNYTYRMHGPERPLISVTDKEVEESMERNKLDKAPMFDMKPRSHVVWEKMNVKFTCTVRGSPKPRVTWYKDMVPIEPSLHNAGKFKISNQFGLHTLEINRASIEDSGTYRVSLQNRKGEISSYATLLVRRYNDGRMGIFDVNSGYNMRKPTDYPDVEGMNIPGRMPHAGQIEVQEYDELPETDASRHFKSQLENLDFDVKQLMKGAKLEKDIARADRSLQNGDSVTLDATTKTSELATTVGGDAGGDVSGDDVATKSLTSDASSDGEGGKSKGRFKVAVEISVTNEKRKGSLETFEKVLSLEKKSGEEKEEESDSFSAPQKLEQQDTETPEKTE